MLKQLFSDSGMCTTAGTWNPYDESLGYWGQLCYLYLYMYVCFILFMFLLLFELTKHRTWQLYLVKCISVICYLALSHVSWMWTSNLFLFLSFFFYDPWFHIGGGEIEVTVWMKNSSHSLIKWLLTHSVSAGTDWSSADPVHLSQFTWVSTVVAVLHWTSHMCVACVCWCTCRPLDIRTSSAGFSFTKHQSRLINQTARCDPWCNLLITVMWVRLSDFWTEHCSLAAVCGAAHNSQRPSVDSRGSRKIVFGSRSFRDNTPKCLCYCGSEPSLSLLILDVN